MKELSIVVAINQNGVIGCKGEIPWYLPSDLKRFADLTSGHPVIMGRKTYESVIERLGHPLKNRTNIILTNNGDFKIAESCKIVSSFEEAIEVAEKEVGSEEIFIIGGAEIYKLALPRSTKMYITKVNSECDGDVFFPDYNRKEWKLVFAKNLVYDKDTFKSTFLIYKRKKETFLNFAHARDTQQESLMEKIKKDGVCPFCRENLEKYHPRPIIKEGEWWVVTANMFPYEGTSIHLLFIYKNHAVTIREVESNEAKIELWDLISWATTQYKIDGGAFFVRFGDTERTGGSVNHLHAQLIVGEAERSGNAESLKVKLGYKRKK
ncbi:MAG: dihydrofolate reductase [Patescibacteria group bacterium]